MRGTREFLSLEGQGVVLCYTCINDYINELVCCEPEKLVVECPRINNDRLAIAPSAVRATELDEEELIHILV